MHPKGVRLACPECSWSCVMTHEDDLPEGVTMVVEGVPYCPNHTPGIPMKPVASVDITPRPQASPGLGEGLSLAERLAKIRQAEEDVSAAEREWDYAKELASSKKKNYEANVDTLRHVIEALTSVPPPRPPLLEQMENPACLCGHRQAEHDEAHGCHVVLDDGGECNCELFEVENAAAADGMQALDAAARAGAEALRQRLAAEHIVVDVDTIEAWSLEQYDAVVAYITALETDSLGDPIHRPGVLPPADDTPPLPRRRRKPNATPIHA